MVMIGCGHIGLGEHRRRPRSVALEDWAGKSFYVDPDLPECLELDQDGNVIGVRDKVSGAVVLVPDPTNENPVTTDVVNGKRVLVLDNSRLVPSPHLGGPIGLMNRTIYACAETRNWSSDLIRSVQGNISIYIGGFAFLRVNGVSGQDGPDGGAFSALNLQGRAGAPNSRKFNLFAAHIGLPGTEWLWVRAEDPVTGQVGYRQNNNNQGGQTAFDIATIGTYGNDTLHVGLMFAEAGNSETHGTVDAALELIRARGRALEGL